MSGRSYIPLRVLFVEDNPDDFELACAALRHAGFDVHACRVSTRAEMEDALRQLSWDVVLCDWILPSFSAPEAIAMVCAREPRVPCVVFSGVVGEETAVLAMKLGAKDFCVKDRPEALAEIVRRELLLREVS